MLLFIPRFIISVVLGLLILAYYGTCAGLMLIGKLLLPDSWYWGYARYCYTQVLFSKHRIACINTMLENLVSIAILLGTNEYVPTIMILSVVDEW